ncbi:RimK family protein [Enterovibrio paralichthyis]|uniref:RimK family protein n=1 Tax=Enterovibrio paralichthyis TaxID=2853805 RepID=UPI001C43780D|nr:RimK family protein [Enterovibrio paralichthyis]MBV7299210.1 RimK family protein [Enterovibrio paralichthyis]
MANILIVTDETSDWKQYFPSEKVVTVNEYLATGAYTETKSTQVINLCRSYDYMSSGYYCSLMAEARGHRVIPRVMTINDLNQQFMLKLKQTDFDRHFKQQDTVDAKVYFGRTPVKGLEKVAHQVFEHFMVPVLDAGFIKVNGKWQLARLEACPFQTLDDNEQDFFAESLELFSQKVWRGKKKNKKYRYDIAMLIDPEEKLPPSDPKAIRRFQRAANRLGINMEAIGPNDLARLGEFDGLFIRATTNISNFTYKFAKAAENLGLVVMDDPESIMKCTNKVFLTELLSLNKVPTPKSVILRAGAEEMIDEAISHIGFPMVLKVPDGAFSIGVVKAKNREELVTQCQKVFEKSALILAQEYLPTDFDWRIGVLNRQPIYACKYLMSRGHWQIYQHHDSGRVSSGGFETLDIKMVPKCVVDAAVKAANLIGSGIYGVDVKEIADRAYVIEVNDNPSIDHHVEDGFLGDLLYDRIVTEFLRRIQMRGL